MTRRNIAPPPERAGILWFRNILDGGVIMIDPGQHTFLAGRTGAGKSKLIRQLIRNAIPAAADGYVQLYGIDLKDGVEFECWRHWMTELATDLDSAITLLEHVDGLRRERNEQLRAKGETTATIDRDMPLIVVLIDEMGELAGAPDRDTKAKQEKARYLLDRILRLGRSAGVTVVAATQDPRKEATPLRDRFPNRIALALNSRAEAIMMMGEDAVRDGCAPHAIAFSKPGVGYWHDAARHEAVRFRTVN